MLQVIQLLHIRGQTVTSLAREAGVGRAHLCQVLANRPGRGWQTRKKVAPLLTVLERSVLGWDSSGKLEQKFPVEPVL